MSPWLRELVTDILLRLPVGSLLRFRCLSTSLCTEIDGENFVKNHLIRSFQGKTRQKLLIYNPRFEGPSDFYYADFDDDLVDAFPLKKPLVSHHRNMSVYGSCNGLILLGMDPMDLTVECQSLDLSIWNPFTRRYKKLLLCPVQNLSGYREFKCSGLGYDSAHDDYKVVVISKVDESNQVWVFGLKSDFWRRSRDLEDEFTTSVGCFANGALFWICKNKCVGFDLEKEVFFDVPLLSDCGPATFFFDSFDSLVDFGGNLYFRTLHAENVEFYLLVSDDKGGDVSWRKELTIENVETTILHDVFPLLPLAYSKDGDSILLHDVSGVFWHKLENKTNQRVNVAGLPDVPWSRYNVCWESLVSVGKDSAFDGASEEVMITDDLEE